MWIAGLQKRSHLVTHTSAPDWQNQKQYRFTRRTQGRHTTEVSKRRKHQLVLQGMTKM